MPPGIRFFRLQMRAIGCILESDQREMGPSCEVLLGECDAGALDTIDGLLVSVAERINRTRKGRVWEIWVRGRPVQVNADGLPFIVTLSAGCNDADDYRILRELAALIANALGGIATEPEK